MKLTLVVPSYNEQDNVALFYETAMRDFAGSDYTLEFVFVNDGSSDETLARLKALYEQDEEHIVIVSFSRNFGKESAIYAGLQAATGDYITLIDADLQQRPQYARDMADYLTAHTETDCVCMYQEQRREGAVLSFFKNRFYHIINSLSDVRFMQGASDFRTFRSAMKDAILSMTEYHRFSKGIFAWVGFQTHYMPYIVEQRNSGESKWSFTKLFRYAVDGVVGFSVAPLKLAIWCGMLSAVVAFVYTVIVIIQKLCFDIAVSGFATTVILIMFFGGIQMLTLGIIGEYLARTYMEVKRRPIYIAKEIIRKSEPDEKR